MPLAFRLEVKPEIASIYGCYLPFGLFDYDLTISPETCTSRMSTKGLR